jgi:hypothetical protein
MLSTLDLFGMLDELLGDFGIVPWSSDNATLDRIRPRAKHV